MSHVQRAQRAQVAVEALTWLQTPYHHHARLKGVGVDCAQLLCAVYEVCGLVPKIDTGYYPVDWHMHRSQEMFSGWLQRYAHTRAPGSPLQIGDVLLFKFGRTFSHGSIVVQVEPEPLVVHSYIKLGVLVSRLTEAPLAGRDTEHWSLWPEAAP